MAQNGKIVQVKMSSETISLELGANKVQSEQLELRGIIFSDHKEVVALKL